MKLQKSKNGVFFLTIPSVLVKLKKWQKRDEIIIVENKRGDLCLKKQEPKKEHGKR